jgi:Fe2+ transport system protein B
MNTRTAHTVTATTGPVSLKTALLLDAVVTGANGLAYVAGAAIVDSVLGPSSTHLLVIGVVLAICSVTLGVIGTRRPISRGWAMFAAEVNIAWAAGSIAVVALGWLDLTMTGEFWTIMQAVVVAAFAALQITALRRR